MYIYKDETFERMTRCSSTKDSPVTLEGTKSTTYFTKEEKDTRGTVKLYSVDKYSEDNLFLE